MSVKASYKCSNHINACVFSELHGTCVRGYTKTETIASINAVLKTAGVSDTEVVEQLLKLDVPATSADVRKVRKVQKLSDDYMKIVLHYLNGRIGSTIDGKCKCVHGFCVQKPPEVDVDGVKPYTGRLGLYLRSMKLTADELATNLDAFDSTVPPAEKFKDIVDSFTEPVTDHEMRGLANIEIIELNPVQTDGKCVVCLMGPETKSIPITIVDIAAGKKEFVARLSEIVEDCATELFDILVEALESRYSATHNYASLTADDVNHLTTVIINSVEVEADEDAGAIIIVNAFKDWINSLVKLKLVVTEPGAAWIKTKCCKVAGKKAPTYMHKSCFTDMLEANSMVCPICKTQFVDVADGPPGTMTITTLSSTVENPIGTMVQAIQIKYIMPSGVTKSGIRYDGESRTTYLPNDVGGKKVLDMFIHAFKKGLLFTIGRSVTRGLDNVIVWNGVHQKTNTVGGSASHGYPDDTYYDRVGGELASLGILEPYSGSEPLDSGKFVVKNLS